MDREHFTRLVEEPVRVQRDDIADLKAMTERYPWFSAAHLLLAVGEHRQGDVLFDEQLRTSAAHLPSRAVLFDLVHPVEHLPQPTLRIVPKTEPVIEAAPAIVEEPVVAAPPVVEKVIAEPERIVEVAPPVVEEPPMIEEPEPVVMEVPPVVEEPTTTAEEELPIAEEQDPLDAQVRQAALASSYELLLGDSIPVPEPEPPAPPKPIGRMSFSSWLDGTPGATTGATAPKTRSVQPAQPATDPAAMAATKELIDRFIQQATPPPSPKKAEFFSPQQAAKRSLEDHADMVTETLARIYEKQGNLAKARAAYARLAEKHPDRREHFLGLARALDQR